MPRGARADAGDRGFDGVAHQRVGIDLLRHAVRQPQRGDTDDGRPQQPQRHLGVRRRRKQAVHDAALHARQRPAAHLGDEREALVLLAHARHVAVQEHQREVLRLVLAELVEPPGRRPHVFDGVGARGVGQLARAEVPEALFGQRVEDFVFRGEVAVDGAGAVFHARRDIADRGLAVAVADEEVERRVENGAPGRLAQFEQACLTAFGRYLLHHD
jgi:hypothetical protein